MQRNTTIHLRTSLILFIGCAPVAACSASSGSGSGGSGASTLTADDLCSAVGDRAVSCNSSIDKTTVVNDCTNRFAALYPKLRSDLVSGLASCVQSSDCTHASSFVNDCLSTKAASLAPSSAATQLCGDLATAEMKCSSGTFDEANCLDKFKIFSDGALSSADQCTSHACSDIQGCVTSALGGTGAISGSGSSTGSSSGSIGSTGSSSGSIGSTGSSSGSTGSTAACQSHLNANTACGACMEASCCAQVAACFGDASCAQCASGGTCGSDAPTTNLNSCIAANCNSACGPKG